MNKMNKRLLHILVFMICILPATYFSSHKVIDSYNSISLATVEKSIQTGRISEIHFGDFSFNPYDEGHLGYESMIIILSEASGIEAREIAFYPIGGLLVPIIFFALTMRLFSSSLISLLSAIFIAYDPSLMPGNYSIFAYTWERILMFTFIIVVIRYLRDFRGAPVHLVLLTIFLGTFSLYWTSPFLMVVILASLGVLLKRSSAQGDSRAGRRGDIGILTIATIVIYVAFSRVLYKDFLTALLSDRYGGISNTLSQFFAWVSLGESSPIDEYSLVTSGITLYDSTLVLRYLIILLPIAAYVIMSARTHLRRKGGELDVYSGVMWPVMAAAATQSVAYGLLGRLSFRYVTLLFVPLTIISLRRLGLEKYISIVLVFLVALVAFSFSIIITEDTVRLNETRGISNSTSFVFEHTATNSSALMDLNTFGIYLLEGVTTNENLRTVFYDSENFGLVVNPPTLREDVTSQTLPDYVIVNIVMSMSPTVAPNWRHYEPIGYYLDEIAQNSQLGQVFSDGFVLVLVAS